MGPVASSQHELRHDLGAAIALQLLAPHRYGAAMVQLYTHGANPRTLVTVGDVENNPPNMELSQQVMGLAALGPAAPMPGVVEAIKAQDFLSIAKGARLSDADLELLNHAKGHDASVKMARVLLGVGALEVRLGVVKFQRLSKLLRDGCNQGVHEWPLSELVPQAIAQDALERAAAKLSELMGAADQATTSRLEVQAMNTRVRAPVKGRIS